jgi:ribosome-binding factor A
MAPAKRSHSRRGFGAGAPHRYPRAARVNVVLREVLADALERLECTDDRLGLLTVTAVQCDPDLRHAVVYLSSLDKDEAAALASVRVRLQAAISQEVHLKRTPQLRFEPDPGVAAGNRIEDILRGLPRPAEEEEERP